MSATGNLLWKVTKLSVPENHKYDYLKMLDEKKNEHRPSPMNRESVKPDSRVLFFYNAIKILINFLNLIKPQNCVGLLQYQANCTTLCTRLSRSRVRTF